MGPNFRGTSPEPRTRATSRWTRNVSMYILYRRDAPGGSTDRERPETAVRLIVPLGPALLKSSNDSRTPTPGGGASPRPAANSPRWARGTGSRSSMTAQPRARMRSW
jgi:hypothetical protein